MQIHVQLDTMEQDEMLTVRVPGALRASLERERRRMSKAAGAEVKQSAVIRAILEQHLRSARKPDGRAGARA